MKNIAYIDALRGIGALIIAFYHFSGVIGIPHSSIKLLNKILDTLSAIGYIPVEMFFFFSGYLMIYHYAEKIYDIDLFEFLKKRINKIFPFLVINIGACSLYILIRGGNVSLYQIFYNVAFLQCGYFPGNGDFRIDVAGCGTWFVAPLIFSNALFFYISKYQHEEKAFGLYIAIVIIGMIALKNNWNYPILNGYMLRGLLGFFAGCVFSVIVKRYGLNISKLTIFFALLVVVSYIGLIYLGEYVNTIDFVIFTDIATMPSIMVIFEGMSWLRKAFAIDILKKIGAFSMQLFFLNLPISHYFKLFIVKNFSLPGYSQYLLYFLSLFAFALLFDHLITFVKNLSGRFRGADF